jgi:hypothetical protein
MFAANRIFKSPDGMAYVLQSFKSSSQYNLKLRTIAEEGGYVLLIYSRTGARTLSLPPSMYANDVRRRVVLHCGTSEIGQAL